MIIPYFDYGDFIYYSATQELALKFQRLLNKALRIAFCYNTNEHNIKQSFPDSLLPQYWWTY